MLADFTLIYITSLATVEHLSWHAGIVLYLWLLIASALTLRNNFLKSAIDFPTQETLCH